MRELLRAMEEYAAMHTVPVIGRDSAGLLLEALAARGPEAILEIGAAIGYSTVMIAGKMSPTARITTIESDPARAAAASGFFARANLTNRIDLLVGDAAELLPGLPGPFDFVFIDAAKAHYLDYLRRIIGKLRPGAVIFADNVHFYGMVTAERPPRRMRTIVKRMRAFLEFLTTDRRFDTAIYSVGDGVVISSYRGETNP